MIVQLASLLQIMLKIFNRSSIMLYYWRILAVFKWAIVSVILYDIVIGKIGGIDVIDNNSTLNNNNNIFTT